MQKLERLEQPRLALLQAALDHQLAPKHLLLLNLCWQHSIWHPEIQLEWSSEPLPNHSTPPASS